VITVGGMSTIMVPLGMLGVGEAAEVVGFRRDRGRGFGGHGKE